MFDKRKQCKICLENLDAINFPPSNKNVGLYSKCIDCTIKTEGFLWGKYCSECKIKRPYEHFSRSDITTNGFSSRCNFCNKGRIKGELEEIQKTGSTVFEPLTSEMTEEDALWHKKYDESVKDTNEI